MIIMISFANDFNNTGSVGQARLMSENCVVQKIVCFGSIGHIYMF